MPTIWRWNGYRFYFFSNEGYESPHIHVDKGNYSAKIWLSPIADTHNYGFNDREISVILSKVSEKQTVFLEAWNAHFQK